MHATPLRRPFLILPAREQVVEDLRADGIRLVPHACDLCGALITAGALCTDCEDRARPHDIDDPYDIIGGDHGAE
jgi:hypothetical protein